MAARKRLCAKTSDGYLRAASQSYGSSASQNMVAAPLLRTHARRAFLIQPRPVLQRKQHPGLHTTHARAAVIAADRATY